MLKIKDLIAALKEFPPESEPFVVFHVEGYGTVLDEIGWVSDNNGHAQINTASFCEDLERVEERAARQRDSQSLSDREALTVEQILAAL